MAGRTIDDDQECFCLHEIVEAKGHGRNHGVLVFILVVALGI